jgi:hypothetical protein
MKQKHRWNATRFRIAHLIVLTALVAVSLTWPVLAFFTVPLLFVGVLARFGFASIHTLVFSAGLSFVLGIGLSIYYWGYPFVQPRLLKELRDIAVVEQISAVSNLNPRLGVAPTVTAIGQVPSALLTNSTQSEACRVG